MKIPNQIIRDIEFPSCKNCVHYRPTYWSSDFTSLSNKCDKFGAKDVVTDKITYDYADSCRRQDDKCGKEGKFFEKQPRLILKKIKHKMFNPVGIVFAIPTVYLAIYYCKFVM